MVHERQTVHWRTFLYPGQLIFGALFGVLGWDLIQRLRAGTFGLPGALEALGLGLLLFAFVAYLSNLHKRDLEPDYSKRCYNCKLPVNRWSEFCEHCGADQVERHQLVECKSCQAVIYATSAHCPECGTTTKGAKKVKQ